MIGVRVGWGEDFDDFPGFPGVFVEKSGDRGGGLIEEDFWERGVWDR